MNICIGDGDPIVRRGLRSVLEEQGWRVVGESSNGLEAVDQILAHRPALAALDAGMPHLNGPDTVARIIRSWPGARIILRTASAEEPLVRRCLQSGAMGIVMRPGHASELMDAAGALCRGQCYFPDALSHFAAAALRGLAPRWELTSREAEVVQAVAEGLSNKETAERMGISQRTVEAHRAVAMDKTQSRSVAQLVLWAVRNHLVEP